MAAGKMFPLKSVLLLLLFIFKLSDVDCDCTLSIKDFDSPSPVYLKDGQFLNLDADGNIRLKRSDVVTLACAGRRNSVALNKTTLGYDVLEAHCIGNQTFRVERKIAPFKQFKCLKKPTFTSKPLNRSCHEDGKLYQIGYQIKTKFHSVYEACFNNDLLQTYYVKYTLEPSKVTQTETRPNFQEGELFGAVRMSQLYKVENQRRQIDSILGKNASNNYITKSQFLTRGHLAARADFTLSALTRATFHYVNAAPQWAKENTGDWQMLEGGLRRRIVELNSPVRVYTGTLGTLSLGLRPAAAFYLHTDENNNRLVPVPQYFYKLVYEPSSKSATAFVTVNSPFYKNVEDMQFCDDVCGEIPWLRWKANDGFFSFCCSYKQFADTVSGLERLDVDHLFI